MREGRAAKIVRTVIRILEEETGMRFNEKDVPSHRLMQGKMRKEVQAIISNRIRWE